MSNKQRPTRNIPFLLASTTLLAFLLLASYNPTQPPQGTSIGRQSIALQVPAAIETYSPPTTTPDLRPTPTYSPRPTLEPPPAAQTFPADKSLPAPNIAWSAEGDNSLTIWVGRYTDSPSAAITASRPVARWNNIRLSVLSLVVSPDGQSLAVLFAEPCIPAPPPPTQTPDPSGTPQIKLPNSETECEGDWPEHIYVIDLKANKVQSIPDYYSHYPLYEANGYPNFSKLLGWFDNDRFGVALKGGQMVTAAKDGSSFIQRTWPGQGQYDYLYGLSLFPDHKTLFAWVSDGFFFRDAPTGAIRKVGNRLEGT